MPFPPNHLLLFFLFAVLSSGCNEQQQQHSKAEQPATSPHKAEPEKTTDGIILFFGNSLTAGYGIEPDQAFPALIQEKLDSLSYRYQVIDAGVSGETTASGNSRVDWVLQQQSVDVFVLELGGNDGLRGIPTTETQKNLEEIIDKVRAAEPGVKIILAGMMVPPNMGEQYSEAFQKVFREVATEKNVTLLPFLLKDVAGEPHLNLDDGIHPNAKGHKIVAENVWEVLKEQLEYPAP